MGLSDLASLGGVGAAVGVLATYGAYTGISVAAGGTVLSSLGGALAWMSSGAISLGGGLAVGSMTVLGGLVAGPALAIKKADAMIDQFQAIEKMAKLFTRQITKCDALFSLSQGAIATMKKHHYDTSLYNQEEKDQLCVTVSTLFSLRAFLKAPIMDEHQKLNKKAQNALNLMRDQMNALESGQESGHYDVAMIQSNQKGLKNL
ncbi:hypothetical protein ID1079_09360 [Helicobacter pylori]